MPVEKLTSEPVEQMHSSPALMKFVALLGSLLFSAMLFLALDWFHGRAVWRGVKHGCGVHDPGRFNAYRPNCSGTMNWGKVPYAFVTNSLGLRDAMVREVPLKDPRPRILILGNSFTQGMTPWSDSYVGMIAARLPQYDLLNGGVMGYSPSNYLNMTRMVQAKGVAIDEAIVFMGVTEPHDEAAVWKDLDASGAVTMYRPDADNFQPTPPLAIRLHLARHFILTYSLLERMEHFLVLHGYYRFPATHPGPSVFDMEPTAWTYRKVSDTDQFHGGFAPLGLGHLPVVEPLCTANV